MKLRSILLLVVLGGFFALLLTNLSANFTRYVDLGSAKEIDGEVHVVGQWIKRDLAHYNADEDLFTFYLQDSLENEAIVRYYDPKPANFEQADRLVLIGKHEGDHFRADKILMKCPSKYEENTLEVPMEQTASPEGTTPIPHANPTAQAEATAQENL